MPNCLNDKAYEDCHEWLLAQQTLRCGSQQKELSIKKWRPPPKGELKFNIGFAWSRQQPCFGASWVVRDDQGSVLLHSHHSFTQVHSLSDAKLRSWEWALSSMVHHRFDKVTFGSSSFKIISALNKPKEWPILTGHIAELLSFTKDKPNWFLLLEPPDCNRGASLIAQSVVTGFRCQSYVARGCPSWLRLLFDKERC